MSKFENNPESVDIEPCEDKKIVEGNRIDIEIKGVFVKGPNGKFSVKDIKKNIYKIVDGGVRCLIKEVSIDNKTASRRGGNYKKTRKNLKTQKESKSRKCT